ncbi:unnamed protein product, partial [Polarella glacialis]
MEIAAQKFPEIKQMHLYTSLPDELMNDPRWATHVKAKVRGRGYWFWKSALANMLLLKGVLRDGDRLLYVNTDSMDMMGELIKVSNGDKTDADLILQSQSHCEHAWSKGDIFELFGSTWDDPHYGLTQQPK